HDRRIVLDSVELRVPPVVLVEQMGDRLDRMLQITAPRELPLEELHVAGSGVVELVPVERGEPHHPGDRLTADEDAAALEIAAATSDAAVELRERALARVRHPVEPPVAILVLAILWALRLDADDPAPRDQHDEVGLALELRGVAPDLQAVQHG